MPTSGPDRGASPSRAHHLPHMPGLDGLRGVALVAVLLFHSRFHWARGGYLGVTTFFVLSGFLITGLLLRERDATGRVRLRSFWGRRARRLAPAVLVLMLVVIAFVGLSGQRPANGLIGDAIASSTWVANWRFVLAHHSYADMFSAPSPFQHMWSLAVEEQVYLILPLVAIAVLGRGPRARRRLLAGILGGLIAASTAAAALLHHSGAAPLHEYYGTDARAAEPLVGALLAVMVIGPTGLRSLGRTACGIVDACAMAAFAGLVVLVAGLAETDDRLYRGGLLLAAVLSALIVLAATQPGGVVTRVLSASPLTALGRISYGAYLFHWPVFLAFTSARTGFDPARLLTVRVAITLALAWASYRLVELPVRLGRVPMRVGLPAWIDATVGLVAALTLVVSVVSPHPSRPVVVTGPAPASQPPAATAAATGPGAHAAPPPPGRTTQVQSTALISASDRAAPPQPSRSGHVAAGSPSTTVPPEPAKDPNALRVLFVGDSMADGLAKGVTDWARTRSDVVVQNLAVIGCPLSRGGTRRTSDGLDWPVSSDCGWWDDPSSDRTASFGSFHPDVVVMEDGLSELPDRKLPQWPDYRHTGQPLFDQWLLTEYSDAIKTLTNGGARVVALNPPCAKWSWLGDRWSGYDGGEGDKRIHSLGTTTQGLAAAGATFEDLFSRLCPNGEFSDTVYGVDNARPDGYHLTEEAATAVAEHWLGPLLLGMRGS